MGPVEVLWDGDEYLSPERSWHQWKYYGMEMGSPWVWTDKQTETITFPHPSDAAAIIMVKFQAYSK